MALEYVAWLAPEKVKYICLEEFDTHRPDPRTGLWRSIGECELALKLALESIPDEALVIFETAHGQDLSRIAAWVDDRKHSQRVVVIHHGSPVAKMFRRMDGYTRVSEAIV